MKRKRLFLLNDQTSPRINAELACEIGLNESIILLQFEYWQSISDHEYEDKYWFLKSIPEIRQTFRFWSVETVKRTVAEIIRKGFVYTGNFNNSKFDKRRWFSLNFDELSKLNSIRIDTNHDQVNLTSSKESAMISEQVNLTPSTRSICNLPEGQFDTFLKVNLTPSTYYKEKKENRQTDMPISGFPDSDENEVGRSVGQSVSSESLFSMCKRQSKGVMTLIKSGIKKHGVKYVKSQIEYCNVKCRNLRAYRFLLSDAINGDFAEGWKDDEIFSETLDSQQKEALEKKKRSESESIEALRPERRKQEQSELEALIASLPAETIEKFKSDFINTAGTYIKKSFRKQGWDSMSVKINFGHYVKNNLTELTTA